MKRQPLSISFISRRWNTRARAQDTTCPDNGGESGAHNAHLRKPEPAVNQHWVEDYIRDGSGYLGYGGIHRSSGRLECLFEHREEYHAEGQRTADADIFLSHLDYLRIAALGADVSPGPGYPEQQEHCIYHRRQEYSVPHGAACHIPVALTEVTGHEGVHSDAGADGYRHHHHLHRESEGQRVQRLLSAHCHIRHECAVHDVVHRLKHHRKYHRDTYAQHQPSDRRCRHSVLFHSCLLQKKCGSCVISGFTQLPHDL